MGYLLDGFCFHVAISDGGAGRGRADVGFPFRGGHEETSWYGGHHGTAIEDRVEVVRGGVDVLDKWTNVCVRASLWV